MTDNGSLMESDRTMTEPWGHKITIHVYVEGDINSAADVSDFYASLAPTPEPEFVGIDIREVTARPVAQGSYPPPVIDQPDAR